jgi:hypothetical protein
MNSRNKKSGLTTNCRKRTRSTLNSPEPLGGHQTSDPLLCLTDLLPDAVRKIQDLETEIRMLKAAHENIDHLIGDLSALTYLSRSTTEIDPKVASKAGFFISTVAAEVTNRMRCAKNAVVFNIPDHTPLIQAHEQLLMACGFELRCCGSVRLRKRSPK